VTCLRVRPRASQDTGPQRSPGPAPFGAWVEDETDASDRMRWWIEHWEAAF
jgi:hypothetical protein